MGRASQNPLQYIVTERDSAQINIIAILTYNEVITQHIKNHLSITIIKCFRTYGWCLGKRQHSPQMAQMMRFLLKFKDMDVSGNT